MNIPLYATIVIILASAQMLCAQAPAGSPTYFGTMTDAASTPSSLVSGVEPRELTRLRQQYNERRDAALKPITASYQQQLELLLESFTQQNQLDAALAVRKELQGAATVDSNQRELRNALLQWKWSWTGTAKETDVFLDFRDDGTVSHRGLRGTWSIVGSRDVKIVQDRGRVFVLRFDAALENYRSTTDPELHGQRSAK